MTVRLAGATNNNMTIVKYNLYWKWSSLVLGVLGVDNNTGWNSSIGVLLQIIKKMA